MSLIKGGRFVADPWLALADDAPVPDETAHVSVSHARWLKEREGLIARPAALGVRLPNTVAPATLAADLGRLALIELIFPRFTDGRAYSQARLLRGRLGYTGELRATGDVLRDQLQFMQRCGIDAFAVSERAASEGWLSAFADFDVFYQPSADFRPFLLRRLGGGFTVA